MSTSAPQHVHQIGMSLRQLGERLSRAGFLTQSHVATDLLEQVETLSERAAAASIVAAYRAWDRLDVEAPNVESAYAQDAHQMMIRTRDGQTHDFGRVELNALTYAKAPFPPARFVQAAAAAVSSDAPAGELMAEALCQFAAVFGCEADWPAIVRAIHAVKHFMQAHDTLSDDHTHLHMPEPGIALPALAVEAVRAVVPATAEIFLTDRCAVVLTDTGDLVPFPPFSDIKADVRDFARRHGLNAKLLWAAVGELEKVRFTPTVMRAAA